MRFHLLDAFGCRAQEALERIGLRRDQGVTGDDGEPRNREAQLRHVEHDELLLRLRLDQRQLVVHVDGDQVDLPLQELRHPRLRVHLHLGDLRAVDVVRLAERIEIRGAGLADRVRDRLAFEILRRAHRLVRERDDAERRLRVIDRDQLDWHPLADRRQRKDGGQHDNVFLSLDQRAERGLCTGPLAHLYIELFLCIQALLLRHEERPVLALHLPREANVDGVLRGRDSAPRKAKDGSDEPGGQFHSRVSDSWVMAVAVFGLLSSVI